MKNGRAGSRIASANPVNWALSPARLIVVTPASQPPRDRFDLIDREGPAEQAVTAMWEPCQETTPEVRSCRLVRIGHGQELEIAAPERHDPVMRPQSLVASTPTSLKPELALDPGSRGIKVGGRVDHMIDPHRFTRLPLPSGCARAVGLAAL